jgi:hypothetical protein
MKTLENIINIFLLIACTLLLGGLVVAGLTGNLEELKDMVVAMWYVIEWFWTL